MSNTRLLRISTLVAALALLLAACPADEPEVVVDEPAEPEVDAPEEEPEAVPPAEPEELIPVRLAGFATGFPSLMNSIVVEKGVGEKHGLDVELLELAQPGQDILALRAGEADLSNSLDVNRFLLHYMQGFQATAINFAYNYRNPLVVPIDSPYESLEDLKGATLGFTDINTMGALIFRVYTTRIYGFDLAREAEIVEGAPVLLLELLEAGDMEAVYTFGSLAFQGVRSGDIRELLSLPAALSAIGLEIPLVVWVVTDEWRQEHGAEGVARLKAMTAEVNELMRTDEFGWDGYADQAGVAEQDRDAFIAEFRELVHPIWGEEIIPSLQDFVDTAVDLVGEDIVGFAEVDPAAFDFE